MKKKKKGQEGIVAAVGLRIRRLRWRALGLACGGREFRRAFGYTRQSQGRGRVSREVSECFQGFL